MPDNGHHGLGMSGGERTAPIVVDARLAETLDIKSGASLSERTPVNVSRGIVEPFEGYAYPKGVAYAAGTSFF
jgi:hypothetical protein